MKKTTRNWLILGAVGAAGLVIWYTMRARSQASTTMADPSIDPTTGIPYAQEQAGYGGYGVSGYGGSVPSQFGYYDPTTGSYITGTGSQVVSPPTNASWAQQVEAYLQQVGYDPTTVSAAIGKYLTGQTLTSDQQGIVAAAVGFFGNPPQGAPKMTSATPSGWQSFRTLTFSGVPRSETLAEYAKAHGWSQARLTAVEQINRLTAGSLIAGRRYVAPYR
jgi:hypothetical protein